MNYLRYWYRRLRAAGAGIVHALRSDRSFRAQTLLGALVVIAVSFYFHPLTELEQFFLILSWTLVLITELQNSSFEIALDKIHPELHDQIGRSKDMAAGAVLIAGLFALFVILAIAQNHLGV